MTFVVLTSRSLKVATRPRLCKVQHSLAWPMVEIEISDQRLLSMPNHASIASLYGHLSVAVAADSPLDVPAIMCQHFHMSIAALVEIGWALREVTELQLCNTHVRALCGISDPPFRPRTCLQCHPTRSVLCALVHSPNRFY
jgi:hypothetical protein